MTAKVSQQILMILDKNWKSFLVTNEVYKQRLSKFNARPRIPGYKNKITGRNIVVYTTQTISKKQLKQGIINPNNWVSQPHLDRQNVFGGLLAHPRYKNNL